MTNVQTESERDRLIARKNQQLGLILAAVIGAGMLIAYLTRFVLWHIVFKQ
jgi:hypothetical protein